MKVRELGQNPISPDKPAGDDAHYEPEFEELQQEIDKLSIASASGEGTDWKKVASLSVTILSEKSKDLLVAVYLATALTRLHGFEGFGAAVAMLNDLVNTFWETMYPAKRRMRGRLNAIAWWQERMESFAKGLRDSPPLPVEQVENAKKALDALDQSLREKVEDAPSMRELVNYVNLLPVQQPEPEAAPAPAQPVSAQPDKTQPEAKPTPQPTPRAQPSPTQQPAPAAQAAHTSPPPAQATDKKEAAQTLSTLLDQLLGLAEFHFQDAPTNPLSYRLRRLWAWLPLAAPPPAEIGQTRIPPPDSIVKPSIEQLLAAGNHEAALRAAESRVTEHRFWLDISRFSATALENLGPSYKSAHAAVCAETLLLLERLQGLENLGFSDGTPFADPETQDWLKSLSLGDNATQTGGDALASAVDQALSQARGLIKDKKPLDAVDLVQQGLESAASGKARLLWRLALGRLLLLAGKPDLATPLNEKNLADMDAHDLEVFDPDLALQVLLLVHETCKAVSNEESNFLEKQILARIVRLDPGQAMRIVGLR
jgi:type VI secretion system protein VasJ